MAGKRGAQYGNKNAVGKHNVLGARGGPAQTKFPSVLMRKGYNIPVRQFTGSSKFKSKRFSAKTGASGYTIGDQSVRHSSQRISSRQYGTRR